MAESWASSPAARNTMKANRSTDTGPERALRSALHKLGLRFRKQFRPLPGERITVDVAFTRVKVAVFVDGCFWHGCLDHGTTPKTHTEFWRMKIETNRRRDRETDERLTAAGWKVMRVWEHEDVTSAAALVAAEVASRVATLYRPVN